MAVDLVLTPEAIEDLDAAYGWYESRRVGLGEEFLGSVDALLAAIRRHPEMHQRVYLNYRRALLRRFPYAVFYESALRRITVYAVFHTARDPLQWRERLS